MQVELSSEHFVFTIYACEDFDEEDTRVEEFEVIASNQQEAIQQVRTEVNGEDRKSTRLNSSHIQKSRMPSSA